MRKRIDCALAITGLVGAATVVVACRGEAIDLDGPPAPPMSTLSPDGSYGGFAGAPCTVPSVLEPDGGDGGDAGALLTPLLGTWTGYIETLPASSGNLALVFAAQADGSVTGTLTFGNTPPPPPPVSATVLYPPGFGGDPNSEPFPYSGFPYTATNVSFDGSRLQFGIVWYELWKAWCELQTSYAWSFPGMCGCSPNWDFQVLSSDDAGIGEIALTGTGETEVVNLGLLETCDGPSPCYCTAAGCSTNMGTATVTFDMQLEGDELQGQVGSVIGGPLGGGSLAGGLNVLLSRSP